MEFGGSAGSLEALKRYPILPNDVSAMADLGAQDAYLLPRGTALRGGTYTIFTTN